MKGEWFAMKMMTKRTIVQRKCIEEIFLEARLLSKLRHQFICNAHYAFQDAQALYLIMDCAMAGDLRYHMNHVTESALRPSDIEKLSTKEMKAIVRRRSSINLRRRNSVPHTL